MVAIVLLSHQPFMKSNAEQRRRTLARSMRGQQTILVDLDLGGISGEESLAEEQMAFLI